MASLFNLSISGPPPGNLTVGSELWIDLGVIPVGQKMFVGKAQYMSPDKSVTFELRTNLSTKSAGSKIETSIMDTCSVTPKSGTLTRDLYKNGRLHITSVLGTGVEHLWLRLASKSGSAADYMFSLYYTLE